MPCGVEKVGICESRPAEGFDGKNVSGGAIYHHRPEVQC